MAIMDNMHPFHGYKFRTDEEELKIATSQGADTETMDKKWPGLVYAITVTLPAEMALRTKRDQLKWTVDHLEYTKGVLKAFPLRGAHTAEAFDVPVSKDLKPRLDRSAIDATNAAPMTTPAGSTLPPEPALPIGAAPVDASEADAAVKREAEREAKREAKRHPSP